MSTTGVQELKAMLMEELGQIVRTSNTLIRLLKADDWSYRPRENMRSVEELVHHLISIPSVDLHIVKECSQEEAHKLEGQAAANGRDPDKLAAWLISGTEELRTYMESLSDDVFLHTRTTPFYVDMPTTQAKWLIEIVTHAQHHRAQLFNYLKELGHPVDMMHLYG